MCLSSSDKWKISCDEYNKLSEEEQKEYRLAAYTKYFQVFNLDQTNFAEKYPNRWDILKAKFSGEEQPQEEKEMYVNPILDEMNRWSIYNRLLLNIL